MEFCQSGKKNQQQIYKTMSKSTMKYQNWQKNPMVFM